MGGLSEEEWEAARALLKGFAHDLNNLLAPLYLYGESLQESLADPVLKQRASAILQRSHSMQNLVECSRWLYREAAIEEQVNAGLFCHQLATLANVFFEEKAVRAYWAAPSPAGKLPPGSWEGRFLLAAKLRQLAKDAAASSAVILLFAFPTVPAPIRAYAGETAALAVEKFGLTGAEVKELHADGMSAMLAFLSNAKPLDIGAQDDFLASSR